MRRATTVDWDLEGFLPKPRGSQWRRLLVLGSVGALLLGGLTLATIASEPRPRPFRPGVQRFAVPPGGMWTSPVPGQSLPQFPSPLLQQSVDRFVVNAPRGIDDAMIVTARAGIDDQMVVNPFEKIAALTEQPTVVTPGPIPPPPAP